jgi:ferredoxin
MSLYMMIDKQNCIGCGACGSAAPDIFDYDADGLAENILDGDLNQGILGIPEEFYEDLQNAVYACPASAIKVAENPFKGNPYRYEQ